MNKLLVNKFLNDELLAVQIAVTKNRKFEQQVGPYTGTCTSYLSIIIETSELARKSLGFIFKGDEGELPM